MLTSVFTPLGNFKEYLLYITFKEAREGKQYTFAL